MGFINYLKKTAESMICNILDKSITVKMLFTYITHET